MSVAGVIADLVGLSEWLPRQLRRAAGWVLVATAVIAPATFRDGLMLFVERQVDRIEQQMQPVLDDLLSPTAPAPTAEVHEPSSKPADHGHHPRRHPGDDKRSEGH